MGHPGEKVALGLGDPAGLRRRFPEIFLVFQLPGFLLVDVAGRDQKLGHVSRPVLVLGDEGHQIPRAVVPQKFPGDRIPVPDKAAHIGDDALEEALAPTVTFMVVSDTQRSPSRLRSR